MMPLAAQSTALAGRASMGTRATTPAWLAGPGAVGAGVQWAGGAVARAHGTADRAAQGA